MTAFWNALRRRAGGGAPALLVLLAGLSAWTFALPSTASFSEKLKVIQRNEDSSGPWQNVTLTAAEVNRYFASDGAKKLPRGVTHLVLSSRPGEIDGSALVDFDAIEGRKNGNPLLAMFFSGVHQVVARAHVDDASEPAAHLTVDQVSLDGQRIPNPLIDFAIDTFVRPRHPNLGRTFAVKLPRHARSASVTDNAVTLNY